MRSLLCFLGAAALAAAQFGVISSSGALTAPSSKVPAEQRCSVAGQVVNALTGEPVKKAELRLTVANVPAQQGYAVSAEADGTFRLDGIEPGTYRLSGQRSGFIQSNFGAKGPRDLGSSITLSPAQNRIGISLALTPQAAISGKVVDEDGEPVSSTMVQVLASLWRKGKKGYFPQQSAQTNDLGEFRLANLAPGKYLLLASRRGTMPGQPDPAPSAKARNDVRPVSTYYPNTTNADSANVIEVKAGQDVPALEIRLQSAQTFHVRGHVTGSALEEGQQSGVVTVTPKGSGGFFMQVGQSSIKADGSFDIPGIAPGAYVASLVLMSGNIRSGGQQSFEVAATDINDLTLQTGASFTLRGIIKVEGAAPTGAPLNLSATRLNLLPADMGMLFSAPRAKIEKDGSFTIDSLTPGTYSLNVSAPSGTYLRSVLNGQTEVKGSDLDWTSGAPGELQVIFRYGVAEISGVAQSGQNTTATAQILLLPETLNADGSGWRLTSTDTNGAFDVKQLAPGRYRLCALAQLDGSQLQNPEVLKQLAIKGTDVEVKENDRKQLNLPLIGADEVTQLLAQAGVDLP